MDNRDMSVADVLNAAADLLTPEGAWTQGSIYRDAEGREAGNMHGEPVCWCVVGAILQVGGSEFTCEAVEEGLPATRPGGLRPLSAWNDAPERTQAEVVAALREAAISKATGSTLTGRSS